MVKTAWTKLEALKKNLSKMEKAAIGFTGGVDSSFLLKIASEVLGKDNILAITIASNVFPQRELEKAKDVMDQFNIPYKIIEINIDEIGGMKNNPIDRCYHCKKHIFSIIKKTAEKEGIKEVLDASNYDDLSDYRPGMKALKEQNVKTPLIDAQLTKNEIRTLSKKLGLKTWDKPSSACLASRFPYGIKITKERVHSIETAEKVLHDIGIKQCRARFHDHIVRIEVFPAEFKKIFDNAEEIVKQLKNIGFKYITLDLEGYRTGSLNEVLNERNSRRI